LTHFFLLSFTLCFTLYYTYHLILEKYKLFYDNSLVLLLLNNYKIKTLLRLTHFLLCIILVPIVVDLKTVLLIRDILVRIRIRGSVPLTNGSGSGSAIFDLQDANQKFFLFKVFFFLLHHFSKKKCQRSHKTVGIKVFLTIFA
jgi:hypothetical protein